MRNRGARRFGFSLVAVATVLLTCFGGVAHATSGSCTDPANDVQDQSGNAVGTGPLDIVKVSHSDTSTLVTYGLQTLTPFDASDIDFVVWGIDTNNDDRFEGYVVVFSGPLRASLLDSNNNVVENGTVVHTDHTNTMSVTIGNQGLKQIGVVQKYQYTVIAQQSYYDSDGAGPCTHILTTPLSTGSLKLSTTTVTVGGTLAGTASGFKAGSDVTVIAHSSAVTLGTATVGADGSAAFSFVLPASVGVGTHTVEVRGVDPSGNVRDETASFSVVAAPAASGAGTLQKTGAPIGKDFAVGMIVLLLGLSWLTLAYIGRRTSDPDEIVAPEVFFEFEGYAPVRDPAEITGPIPVIRPIYGLIPQLPRETD